MKPDNGRTCEHCAFHSPRTEAEREKCWRFARFVEHVLNDWTRDCEYFTPSARRPVPAD
jgi:hypothetical protein